MIANNKRRFMRVLALSALAGATTPGLFADEFQGLAAPNYLSLRPSGGAATTSNPLSAVAGDFDGDGDLDFIGGTTRYGTAIPDTQPGLAMVRNDGSNNFALDGFIDEAWPVSAAELVAGDLDGDGDLDLAAADDVAETLLVLLNAGDGTFAAPVVYPAPGIFTKGLTLGDFDNDGDLDIALGSGAPASGENGGRVAIYNNNGGGSFTLAMTLNTVDNTFRLDAADMDDDGHMDLIVCGIGGPSEGSVDVLLNDGLGGFLPPAPQLIGNPAIAQAHAADMNGDGMPDIVVSRFIHGVVTVMLNQGDGLNYSSSDVMLGAGLGGPFPDGFGPSCVLPADLDDDGLLDLIVTGTFVFGGPGVVGVFSNDGEGGFTIVPEFAAYPTQDVPAYILAEDVGGSSLPDVIVVNQWGDSLGFYTNLTEPACNDLTGDGVVNVSDLGVLLVAYQVNADGDLDGDGDTDVSDLGALLSTFGTTCD